MNNTEKLLVSIFLVISLLGGLISNRNITKKEKQLNDSLQYGDTLKRKEIKTY